MKLDNIRSNLNNPAALVHLLPIVKCSFIPTKYEQILMTRLRNKETPMMQFRVITKKLASLLVFKIIEILPVSPFKIETPLSTYIGINFNDAIDFVSIMRSGDALLETFVKHFPDATISKILIQREEMTATPHFKYMKFSPTIGKNSKVVITEPMIATGGTLSIAIQFLKEKGVKEENIIIASICTCPEGLLILNENFPNINVVMSTMDNHLNENKYIVPGIGDFGDRYYGTTH
jgi:uracil phosphoribosyltransferase